jgi:hypothetical protein
MLLVLYSSLDTLVALANKSTSISLFCTCMLDSPIAERRLPLQELASSQEILEWRIPSTTNVWF